MLNSLFISIFVYCCFDSRKQTKDELNNENHETNNIYCRSFCWSNFSK